MGHEEGLAGGDGKGIVLLCDMQDGVLDGRELRARKGAEQGDVSGELVDFGREMCIP